jgi:hypothetical protein
MELRASLYKRSAVEKALAEIGARKAIRERGGYLIVDVPDPKEFANQVLAIMREGC